MPIVNANGIEINYRLEGDGPETIVLVNGLADDLETWAYQTEDFLAAGYPVLAFDTRGVGASGPAVGSGSGVRFVRRDVTRWASPLPFFEQREDELREFEAAMAEGTQPLEAYLAQLSSIRTHDTTSRLDRITA